MNEIPVIKSRITVMKCKNYGKDKGKKINPLIRIRNKQFLGHEGETWEVETKFIRKMKKE